MKIDGDSSNFNLNLILQLRAVGLQVSHTPFSGPQFSHLQVNRMNRGLERIDTPDLVGLNHGQDPKPLATW